uniref:TOG domain-containing protein n=1 Tax=Salix viminalis TaxID=40686 RepID=A0A6N2K2E5_SALVM
MALRPIVDNALPVAPERPKKNLQVVSVPLQKQSEVGVNDENKAPLPPSSSPIDYISSDNLKPISDPESKIQGLIERLDSKDWTNVCESLNNIRRFALYHSSLLLPFLEKVMSVVVKCMKNPRSALIKTSIMASSDIFYAFGDQLLDSISDAFDNLLLQLLLKASQDKKFVCEEADKALNAMVQSMTPLPLLNKLKPYVSHVNLRIRAKAAISISNFVSKMGLEGMDEFGLVSLVQVAADLLNDRLPEAREAARRIVISVYEAYTGSEEQKQEEWQSFCQSSLPPIHVHSLVKITSIILGPKMALKPIDNALPLPQEAIILGVNEENKTAASLPPADPIIDYISSGNLEPISDPESKIHGLVEELDSKDWTKSFLKCSDNGVVAEYVLYREKVVLVVVKAMKNPRSALCKTSIMASSDIFKVFGDQLLDSTNDAFDNLLLQLLLKASQDKRFVCEEADRALNAMVKSMTPLPLLNKLRPYVSHSNPRVRAKAAITISNSVSKMGLEGMNEFGLVLLVQMAADLLNDRLPEAREAARNIVTCIYEAYTRNEEQKQESWQNFCQSSLPPIHAQSMLFKVMEPCVGVVCKSI